MPTVGLPNTQAPVTAPGTGLGTMPWLAWFRDVQAAINSLNASVVALQASVSGIEGGSVVVARGGLTTYPLGGGDVALLDNPSDVWMTVRNAYVVRIDWDEWAGRTITAYLTVHSDANAVSVTPRVVAVDSNGAVTRVLGTGVASVSTGTYTFGWSPLQAVGLEEGTGIEYAVLQVSTASVGQLITATGYLEAGAVNVDYDPFNDEAFDESAFA